MHNTTTPENLTVSLDYSFPPKLEIYACFTAAIDNLALEECLSEVARYQTEHSIIYLFPVFKELAKQYNVKFLVKYNTIWSIRRYLYATLIALGNYAIKKQGLDKYKENMKVI